jgi:putative sterol carrier protein
VTLEKVTENYFLLERNQYDLSNSDLDDLYIIEKPDVTLVMKDGDLVDLMTGKLNSQKAFFQGKLKVRNVYFSIRFGWVNSFNTY